MNLKLLLHEYYAKNKTFPPLIYLSKAMHINLKKVEGLCNEYVKRGILKKVGNEFYFNLISAPSQSFPIQENTPKQEISFDIVRYVMGVIAIIAMVFSSYYTALWLNNFIHIVPAWVCACTIVFYASFSIQAATHNKSRVKYLLRGTAIIAILFSMISTIGGQYRNDSEKKQDNTDQAKISGLDLLKAEEKSLVESMESIKQELDDNARLLSQFKKNELESKEYKNIFWKGYTLRNMREKTGDSLRLKREEIREYTLKENISITKIEGNTFYSWIATFLPFNPSTIEFYLYLFPALFFDVISPLGLYVFLKKKEN
jgi:hypothetical protein